MTSPLVPLAEGAAPLSLLSTAAAGDGSDFSRQLQLSAASSTLHRPYCTRLEINAGLKSHIAEHTEPIPLRGLVYEKCLVHQFNE